MMKEWARRIQACRKRAALSRVALFYQALRNGHRIRETGAARLAATRDVEGRAVIRTRPHEWQTERNIHGRVEVDRLQRREPLVVIKRDDHIELTAKRARKACRPADTRK